MVKRIMQNDVLAEMQQKLLQSGFSTPTTSHIPIRRSHELNQIAHMVAYLYTSDLLVCSPKSSGLYTTWSFFGELVPFAWARYCMTRWLTKAATSPISRGIGGQVTQSMVRDSMPVEW